MLLSALLFTGLTSYALSAKDPVIIHGGVAGIGPKSVAIPQKVAESLYKLLFVDGKSNFKLENIKEDENDIIGHPDIDGGKMPIHLDASKGGRRLGIHLRIAEDDSIWCLRYHWDKETSIKAIRYLEKEGFKTP